MLRAFTLLLAAGLRYSLASLSANDILTTLENLHPPKTVDELDIDKYVGDWFQTFASWTVLKTFEKGGYCIKAKYGSGENDTITVNNTQRIGCPDGELKQANGYAYVPDDSEPGKLKVHFTQPEVPRDGDYWVLMLGPVEKKQYQWSVVSDPLRLMLFVLARDPKEFHDTYEKGVLEHLKSLGFVFPWNKPIPTPWYNCTNYDMLSLDEDASDFTFASSISRGGGPWLRGTPLAVADLPETTTATTLTNGRVEVELQQEEPSEYDDLYFDSAFELEFGDMDDTEGQWTEWVRSFETPAHASCKNVVWEFGSAKSCGDVAEALRQAAEGMGGMEGCANGGERCGYEVQEVSGKGVKATHTTPQKHYVDDIEIELTEGDEGGCRAVASSVSRTWYAVLDWSTNYCNLKNIVDATGLAYSESGVSDATCTQYSTADCDTY